MCESCFQSIDRTPVSACPGCHASTENGLPCPSCRSAVPFVRMLAAMPYHESAPIGALIHAYKYAYSADAGAVLTRIVRSFVETHAQSFDGISCIVPVPLHPRRYAERGFNQASMIAHVLAEHTHMPVYEVLRRTRYTKQQARLSKHERQGNVEQAFMLDARAPSFIGAHVLLVDDVYTTGSTMAAAARVHMANHATAVTGFVLARG